MKAREGAAEFEKLRKSSVFGPLDSDILRAVWEAGNVREFREGQKLDISTPTVEFLNLILSGQLLIERLTPDHEISQKQVGSGFLFGSIDSVLGTGRFLSAKVTLGASAFTLHRDELVALLLEFPDLGRHLSRIRLAISMRMAQEYQKRLEAHHSLAGGDPVSDVRVAPRLPVAGRDLFVRLQNGEFRRVDNVSDTGLFILGAAPGAIGTPLRFAIKDKTRDMDPIEMAGIVSRTAVDGFGVRVTQLTVPAASAWDELVTSALSLEIDAAFRPKLTELKEPLASKFVAEGNYHQGHLLSLSVEGGILRSSANLKKRHLELVLELPSSTGSKSAIKIHCDILGKKENLHLLRFEHLVAQHEAAIRSFLSISIDTQKPAEAALDQSREWKGIVHRRVIPNTVELCRLFFRELKDQLIFVQGPTEYRKGDLVRVQIELAREALPVARSQNRFLLQGTVARLSDGGVVVNLDGSALPAIQILKGIADHVSRNRTDYALNNAVTLEHNVKNRRFVQAALILGLLCACIWWAWHALQSVPA